MCGIVGLISRHKPQDRARLGAMRDKLVHRGPDDSGLWLSDDGRVGFGFQRLAIIDLSPAGHQPMSRANGRLQIIFNGEIYNYLELKAELTGKGHVFTSHSDTEVILAAYLEWGRDMVPRLNGMFALALWDGEQKKLLIARDRAGEKPLFYLHTPELFFFASELKALFAHPEFPRTISPEGLDHYLAYGYVPGTKSILAGVKKLAPGTLIELDLESFTSRVAPYWELPQPRHEPLGRANELVEELETLLLDAVRRQMIADVPIGILLSGGIDSSLVTAMAARVSSKPVKTFTIAFPGQGAYNEAPFARQVAEHFGTDHVEFVAEAATVSLLPELARQFDEPMADSSMIPTFVVSRLIRQHATVALGGDGGDELFGGYPHHSWVQRDEHWRRRIPRPFRAMGSVLAERMIPVGMPGRNHLIGFSGDNAKRIAHINLYFDHRARRQLVRGISRNGWLAPEASRAELCPPGQTALQQVTTSDFRSYMVDDILTKVDRASMLTSLEVRAPFLDVRIIEMAFGRVPDALRATERERKILPRMLAAKLLPKSLDLRRKQGFSIPLASWLKGDTGRYFEDVLSQADPAIFDPRSIRSLFTGQRRGLRNAHRIFALTVFELWRREYGATL